MPISDWDPTSIEVRDHSDAVLARMRAECPVAWSDAFGGFWALSKYEDINYAGRHPEIFSIEEQFVIPQQDFGGIRWKPQQSDPPEHKKYRDVLQPAFTPARVRSFEKRFREFAIELIESAGRPSEIEFCRDYGRPYTGGLLCLFLGFPDSDKHQLTEWTMRTLAAAHAQDLPALSAVFQEISAYITALREDRRANPRPPGEDLMSQVLAGRVDGEPLSDPDIEGMFKQLMSAGHETSGTTLASLVHYLAENPDLQDRLRQDPGLVPAAVEEAIRMWGAVFGLARTTRCPVTLRDTTIPEGELVALLWSSAGNDEEIHPDADVFRLDRERNAKHLSFGTGVHRCIGADLARMSLRVAVEELLARTISITPAGPTSGAAWPARGIGHLPLTVEWAG
ncbi:cytochrome P450 family protein [Jatrophihabitans fulvus]